MPDLTVEINLAWLIAGAAAWRLTRFALTSGKLWRRGQSYTRKFTRRVDAGIWEISMGCLNSPTEKQRIDDVLDILETEFPEWRIHRHHELQMRFDELNRAYKEMTDANS